MQLQGRVLCKISLLIILLIALSAYSPWDFLGLYDKAYVADTVLEEQEHIKATGYVYHKEIKNNKVLYYVKNASITSRSETLSKTSFIFKLDSDEIPNFCKLNIDGKVQHFSVATNEGTFDMAKYYNSLGLYFEITDIEGYSFTAGYLKRLDIPFKLRKQIAYVYSSCLPAEEAGFLASVVVGEKGALDMSLKNLFQNVGIAHILAVSGLHVSVICMGVYSFFRKRRANFTISGIFAGSISIVYGFLTGGSISSIRAIGMFLVYLGAQILGESYDMLTSLSLLGLILLLQEPLYITNSSFIFSFGAVLSIALFVLPVNNVYTNYCRIRFHGLKPKDSFYAKKVSMHRKLFEYLINSLIFSFSMFVGMLPIVTGLFYQTPILGVVLNLLILPLMPFLLGIGLVAGLMGAFWLPGSSLFLLPCHFIIYFYEMISDIAYKTPHSTVIVGKRGIFAIFLYYCVLALITVYTKKKDKNSLILLKRKLYIIMGSFLFLSLIWLIPGKGGFEIDALDVGQGDGIYINSGDGTKFFIDGGSTSSDAVGQYTMLPFLKYKGVRSIDYWFLTHMDLDHVSGVIELLEMGYDIKNIVLSSEIPDGVTLSKLKGLAEANGTQIIYMSQGTICGTKHLSFTCIYPYEGMTSDDVNDLSLCLLMKYDKNLDKVADYAAFFGGDIAAAQEQAIAESGYVNHVDLLKVSHHGSRYSSDSSFLQALSPDAAIISCSKKNRYGHPSDEAIKRIEEVTDDIYYTMNSGQIKITLDGIETYLGND